MTNVSDIILQEFKASYTRLLPQRAILFLSKLNRSILKRSVQKRNHLDSFLAKDAKKTLYLHVNQKGKNVRMTRRMQDSCRTVHTYTITGEREIEKQKLSVHLSRYSGHRGKTIYTLWRIIQPVFAINMRLTSFFRL